MRRVNAWWFVALGCAFLLAAVGASAAGLLGPLVVCGADAAAVCVAWPAVASFGTWLLFMLFVAGLAVWHAREWRREWRTAREQADPESTPSSSQPT